MKIILRDNVEKVGLMGQEIEVKDGFARNYLIPEGLAYPAVARYTNVIKKEIQLKKEHLEREKQKALLQAKEMENITLTIEVMVGEEDKMFGSVTSAHIVQKLNEIGFTIEKKRIHIDEPIKSLGIFHVPVKLHPEVLIDIKVWVVKEKTAEELESAELDRNNDDNSQVE